MRKLSMLLAISLALAMTSCTTLAKAGGPKPLGPWGAAAANLLLPGSVQFSEHRYVQAAIAGIGALGGALAASQLPRGSPGFDVAVGISAASWTYGMADAFRRQGFEKKQWGLLNPQDSVQPIHVGMTSVELQRAKGYPPTRINKTVSGSTTKEQWVYRGAGKDEYYWADLIGLQVFNTHDEPLGRVLGLIATSANDVLRVGSAEEGAQGKDRERLLPFVAAVVLDVNLQERRIRVDWEADW